MAARLGVEPIEIVSEHAVLTFRPRELAAVLAGSADPRERPGFQGTMGAGETPPNKVLQRTRNKDARQ